MLIPMVMAGCGSQSTASNTPAADTSAQSSGTSATEKTDAAPAKDNKVYTITYSTINGSNSPMYNTVDAPLMRAIEEASGGRIKFEEYLGGALLKSGENLDGIKNGVVDMVFDAPAWYTGVFPGAILLEQPNMGTTSGEALTWVFYDMIHELDLPEYKDIVVLAPMCSGPRALISNKAVHSLEDMNGLTVRTNSSMAAVMTALGATPVTMGTSEVYEALQSNLVNAGVFSYESMTNSRYYEVCDYIIDLSMVQATVMIYMGREAFERLPEDLQQIITDVSYDFFVSTSSKFYGGYTDIGMNTAKEANTDLEWIHLTDEELARWNEKLEPLVQDYVKTLDDMGLDGEALLTWVRERAAYYDGIYG